MRRRLIDAACSVMSFNPDQSDNSQAKYSTCRVCLAELKAGEKVRRVDKCKHLFHDVCLENWFKNRLSCPLCNKALKISAKLLRKIILETRDLIKDDKERITRAIERSGQDGELNESQEQLRPRRLSEIPENSYGESLSNTLAQMSISVDISISELLRSCSETVQEQEQEQNDDQENDRTEPENQYQDVPSTLPVANGSHQGRMEEYERNLPQNSLEVDIGTGADLRRLFEQNLSLRRAETLPIPERPNLELQNSEEEIDNIPTARMRRYQLGGLPQTPSKRSELENFGVNFSKTTRAKDQYENKTKGFLTDNLMKSIDERHLDGNDSLDEAVWAAQLRRDKTRSIKIKLEKKESKKIMIQAEKKEILLSEEISDDTFQDLTESAQNTNKSDYSSMTYIAMEEKFFRRKKKNDEDENNIKIAIERENTEEIMILEDSVFKTKIGSGRDNEEESDGEEERVSSVATIKFGVKNRKNLKEEKDKEDSNN